MVRRPAPLLIATALLVVITLLQTGATLALFSDPQPTRDADTLDRLHADGNWAEAYEGYPQLALAIGGWGIVALVFVGGLVLMLLPHTRKRTVFVEDEGDSEQSEQEAAS